MLNDTNHWPSLLVCMSKFEEMNNNTHPLKIKILFSDIVMTKFDNNIFDCIHIVYDSVHVA